MTIRFGAYGKLPALGDFLRMDLPQGFVDLWDRWLQDGILTVKRHLGDRWQDCYFSAPIWRFTLSPGIAGASAMTGVMMMSVDRVGRQFPLTLATPVSDVQSALLQHFQSAAMFADLETLALDALEDSMTKDALAQRLEHIARPADPLPPARVEQAKGGLVVMGKGAQGLAPELAAQLAGASFRKASVWGALLDEDMRLMVCEGLPATGQMAGLFDMDAPIWQRREVEVE